MTQSPDDSEQDAIKQELIDLNLEFARRERCPTAADTAWFQDHLTDYFVFRRAGGGVVDRAGFINGLTDPANTSEILEAVVLEVKVDDHGVLAAALVNVTLKGRRGGNDVHGVFLNRRLFRREDDRGWRCASWWNEQTGSPGSRILGHWRGAGPCP